MRSLIFFASVILASLASPTVENQEEARSSWVVGQTVQTSSGPVTGHAADEVTQVSAYWGIPYAQAPIKDLRFAPPLRYSGNKTINGTAFGPDCPISSNFGGGLKPNFTNSNLTARGRGLVPALAQAGDTFSEDCLTLNVWTKPQVGERNKAVMMFIQGGGFTSGASNNVYGEDGVNFVNDEDVVYVSLNYRLNIFGFPGNPYQPNNLGLLDQRLAIEWVRDNIAAFGGDPSRITLFGQSAGAASIDMYSYAYINDPIVAGIILESGSTGLGQFPKEYSAVAWYNVSTKLGCGNATTVPGSVLSCMRKQSVAAILSAIPLENQAAGSAFFWPTIDNVTVFSDYAYRSAAGKFIKVPMLIGNNDFEAGFDRALATIYGIPPQPDSYWEGLNLYAFVCPSAARANASVKAGLPTWRYRYFGDFPDLRIQTVPDSGAYHSAELFPLFGIFPRANETMGIPPVTTAEVSIGKYMRSAWATFAKNPVHGLMEYDNGTWPTWNPSKNTLIRLAYQNKTGSNLGFSAEYDFCENV